MKTCSKPLICIFFFLLVAGCDDNSVSTDPPADSSLNKNPLAIGTNVVDGSEKKAEPDSASDPKTKNVVEDPEEQLRLGMMLLKSGEAATAVRILEQLVEFDPNSHGAHISLGLAFQNLERFDEAVAAYRKALEIKPDSADAHNNLGIAFASQNQPKEAAIHFRRVLDLRPNDASAYKNLGGALQAMGRFEEAVAQYEVALRIRASDAQTHWNLGNALWALGCHDEAISHYRDTLRIDRDYAEAHTKLILALVELGRLEDAKSHLIEEKMDEVGANFRLGNALLHLKRYQEAIQFYEDVLRSKPNNAHAHSRLATSLEGLAHFDKAVVRWTEALQLEPENLQFMNNFAWLLATCPDDNIRDGRKAVELAERAASQSEYKSAIAVGMLAAALAETGKFEEAVNLQSRAVDLAADEQKNSFRERLELYKAKKPFRQESKTNPEPETKPGSDTDPESETTLESIEDERSNDDRDDN